MHRPAIDELLRLLPPKTTRQTMLFSATYPSNIASLAGFALRPGFVTIDTVGEDAQQTADKVTFRNGSDAGSRTGGIACSLALTGNKSARVLGSVWTLGRPGLICRPDHRFRFLARHDPGNL